MSTKREQEQQEKPLIFQQRGPSDAELAREEAQERAHDRFGGTSPGAAFFGWLCAMG